MHTSAVRTRKGEGGEGKEGTESMDNFKSPIHSRKVETLEPQHTIIWYHYVCFAGGLRCFHSVTLDIVVKIVVCMKKRKSTTIHTSVNTKKLFEGFMCPNCR